MGNNLTGQSISTTYQQLVQISGSALTNGTGSAINNLVVYVSNATSSISASIANTANTATSASYATNALSASLAANATTASYALVATSASYSATATSASYAATATSASYASDTDPISTIYETVYAGENLVKTDPVYLSGSNGANPIAFKADAANAAKSPAVYIMNEAVSVGNTGQAIALGLIEGINLTGYDAGQEVYLAAGGGWTATRPTGSASVQVLGIVTKGGAGGKGFVFNAGEATLPNLTAGYAWVGNANGVPVAVATSSFTATVNTGSLLVTASISNATTTYTKGDGTTFGLTVNNVVNATSASLAATATSASYATTALSASYAANALSASFATTATSASQANTANTATSASYATNALSASFASSIPSNLNITASNALITGNLNVNGTASFGYVNAITGAAVIIDDEFIILNAQTPAAPYAGIMVYDTGSAATASFEWNGNGDYWITVEENGASAMILTGISGSKGSEAAPVLNKLLKGQGNNTVADSTITDNGTLVTIQNNVSASGFISASQFVGNVTGTATSASYATTALSASYAATATSASFATNATSASYAPQTPAFPYTGSAQITGSLGITGSQTITGTLTVGAAAGTGQLIIAADEIFTGAGVFADQRRSNYSSSYSSYTSSYELIGGVGPASTLLLQGSDNNAGIYITSASLAITGSTTIYGSIVTGDITTNSTVVNERKNAVIGGANNDITSGYSHLIAGGETAQITAGVGNSIIGGFGSTTISGGSHNGIFAGYGGVISTSANHNTIVGTLNGQIKNTSAYSAVVGGEDNIISGSAQWGAIIGGDTNTLIDYDRSVIIGGQNLRATRNDEVTVPNLTISGSVYGIVQALSISSNTASMDCSTGDFFTLTLANGTGTHLNPSNIKPGQTISVRISQPATTGSGQMTFPSSIKQVSGSAYSPTQGANAQDIITFVSFDATNLYLSNVKNFV